MSSSLGTLPRLRPDPGPDSEPTQSARYRSNGQTMASNHAMSVFTHSLLSTPCNPRTQLPADRVEREERARSASPRQKAKSPPSSSLSSSYHGPGSRTRARVTVTGVSSSPPSSREEREPARPHTAPSMAATEQSLEMEGNLRPSGGGPAHLDYSTLFSTLLESNSLLREEINDLREQHTVTMDAIERLQREQREEHAEELIGRMWGNSGQVAHEVEALSEVGSRPETSVEEGERPSQRPPTRLKKDAWMQTDPPLCRDHGGPSVQCEHSHDQTSAEQLEEDLEDIEELKEEEEEEEEQEGEELDIDLQSVSSAHDIVARGTSSSSSSSDSGSEDDDKQPSESSSHGATNGPFASPGMLMIQQMWDDFSVEDFPTCEPGTRGSPTKTTEWVPRITTPQPFSMTLREAKTPKNKSRSLVIAEQEKIEREAREETELQKQFRATPIPANTYLPLYELINAQNEKRRQDVKQQVREILKSRERPFSFVKRDEEKMQMRLEAQRTRERVEAYGAREKRLFCAKPFPKELFDPRIDEEIREQEEYRRIRIKMRAEELLANSRLPGNMQVKGREYTVGSLRKKYLEEKQSRAFLSEDHKFQPSVPKGIPDHDQAYAEFQQQLMSRKSMKRATSIKPFYLRTQLMPSRKEQVEEDMKHDEEVLLETRWPFTGKRTGPAPISHMKAKTAPYPVQMTRTASTRQSLTQEKLNKALQREVEEEAVERERRERERPLQKAVSQKSMSHDPTAWLVEQRRQKLQQFRKVSQEQQRKYQQELQQMQERVESRPLLLEQPALSAARRSAEAKYLAALKNAGLSEEDLDRGVQGT